MKCKNCGQELGERVRICPICGENQDIRGEAAHLSQDLLRRQEEIRKHEILRYNEEEDVLEEDYERQKSRLIAGLLQLFLGGFGAGRFYLGYTWIAVAQLCTLPLFGIGYIWGFIDGVLILCRQLDLDADGVPLKG